MRKAAAGPPPGLGVTGWPWDSVVWREALAALELPVAVAVFRAAAGLTQRELAVLLGWSPSTLCLLESGRRKSLNDIRVWLRFADTVGIPRVALLPLVLGRADVGVPAGADVAADGGAGLRADGFPAAGSADIR
jgi:DNA-binding XRE family transcriptional regulator